MAGTVKQGADSAAWSDYNVPKAAHGALLWPLRTYKKKSPAAQAVLHSLKLKANNARRAALAQLVRALDCGSRGPPFKPGRRYHFKRIR